MIIIKINKIFYFVFSIVLFIICYSSSSFCGVSTNIKEGIYVVNGLRGGAELKKLKGNDFSLNIILQYGRRNTGFNGSCFIRDGDIICPVEIDDGIINATYEVVVKSINDNEIIIDMPNGGSTDICGAGFCFADEERIYTRITNVNKASQVSKTIDDIYRELNNIRR